MNPVVSVVMPVRDAAAYLGEALDSIIAQTLTDWELIAVDDASADASPSILERYARADRRIRVMRLSENVGIGAALDIGIGAAEAPYLARMDADDVCLPGRFATQVAMLGRCRDVVAVGGQIEEVDAAGRHVAFKPFPTDPDRVHAMMFVAAPIEHQCRVLNRCGDAHPDRVHAMMFVAAPIQHPALMVNRERLPADFSWYDGRRFSEDTYLFFKLLAFGRLSNVPATVLRYRVRDDSYLRRNVRSTFAATYDARRAAMRAGVYRPTAMARVTNAAQYVFVQLIPERFVTCAWRALRSLAVPRRTQPDTTTGDRHGAFMRALYPAISRVTRSSMLASNPLLFELYARFVKPAPRTDIVPWAMPDRRTDLVIESPGSCANHSLAAYFLKHNPGARLATLTHVPAPVHYAARHGIPCLVLRRDRDDCRRSSVARFPHLYTPSVANRCFDHFYRSIEPVAQAYVCADFDDVLRDPAGIITAVNKRFGTTFEPGDGDLPTIRSTAAAPDAGYETSGLQPGTVASPALPGRGASTAQPMTSRR